MSQTKRDLVGADLFVWQLYFDVLVVLPPGKEDWDVEAIIWPALRSLSDLLCKFEFDLSHEVNAGCVPPLISIGDPTITFAIPSMAPSLLPTVVPTSVDTMSVKVELFLTTTSNFTATDQDGIVAAIRGEFGDFKIKMFDTFI